MYITRWVKRQEWKHLIFEFRIRIADFILICLIILTDRDVFISLFEMCFSSQWYPSRLVCGCQYYKEYPSSEFTILANLPKTWEDNIFPEGKSALIVSSRGRCSFFTIINYSVSGSFQSYLGSIYCVCGLRKRNTSIAAYDMQLNALWHYYSWCRTTEEECKLFSRGGAVLKIRGWHAMSQIRVYGTHVQIYVRFKTQRRLTTSTGGMSFEA